MNEKTGSYGYARHILVFIGCCLLIGIPGAICTGANGMFFTPIAEELNAGRSQVSLYLTIMYFVTAVVMPVCGDILNKSDIRVISSFSVILVAVVLIIMSCAAAPWQLWAAGVLEGIGICFVFFLIAPMIVDAWFKIRYGFFYGLCMAMSGVGGMIWNSVGAVWIQNYGWRNAWRIMAVLIIVCCLPFTIFVLRNRPSDVGKKAFGEDEALRIAAENADSSQAKVVLGVSKSVAMKSASFYLILAMGISLAVAAGLNNYFSSYAVSIGLSTVISGSIISVLSLGNMAGKIIIGAINDINAMAGIIVAIICGITGTLLVMTGNVTLMFIGCTVYGLLVGSFMVEVACFTKNCFGDREYPEIYSRTMTMGSFGSGVSVYVYSVILDATGNNYMVCFIFAIAMAIVTFICGYSALVSSKKLVQTAE